MELEKTLKTLVGLFERHAVRYGLIGGYAVAIHGYPRSTIDLDFLVDRRDLPIVDEIMSMLDYKIGHRTENVSQFLSDDALLGEVDFIHAFRVASTRMLAEAITVTLFSEGPGVKVIKVEDIIGLKVQAMANASSRKAGDLDDIYHLVRQHGQKMDWNLVETYFSLFKMDDLYRKIREGHDEIKRG